MAMRVSLRQLTVFLVSGAVSWILAVNTLAQTSPAGSRVAEKLKSQVPPMSSNVYEDASVRIVIPSGWRAVKTDGPADLLMHEFPSAFSSVPPPGNGVVLTKQGYILALAHSAGHASPAGRFGEVFDMPWLVESSSEESCIQFLREYPRPVNQDLIFISLVFDNSDTVGRQTCPIGDHAGVRPWFAGYFTTSAKSWFFESRGSACAEKVYTLTSGAKTQAELPDMNDPVLKEIIRESIEIVASIRYKQCSPGAHDPAN
jgi:hypothetical protein